MDSSTSDYKTSPTLSKKNKHLKKYSSKKDKYSKSKSKHSIDKERRSSYEHRNESLHRSSNDSQRLWSKDYRDKKHKNEERIKKKDKNFREKEKVDYIAREKKYVNHWDRFSQPNYTDKEWPYNKKEMSSRDFKKDYRKETKTPEDLVIHIKNDSPHENSVEEIEVVVLKQKDSPKEATSKNTSPPHEEEPNKNEKEISQKKRPKMYRRDESSIDHYSYLVESESSSGDSVVEIPMKCDHSSEEETELQQKSDNSPEDKSDEEVKKEPEVVEEIENKIDETPVDPSPQTTEENKDPELPAYFPAIQGCRFVEEYHRLNRIDEGTYGVVYRGKDKRTDEIVALKRLKMEKEKEGFPITSLREINTLLKAQHPNIVTVREIVVGCNMDKIYIVMDFVEHDLKSLMESKKDPFLIGEVKTLMIQLLRGVQHLHDNWIIHRDIKTSNLLLSHKGILKVGDFGLAREYGSPLKPYTPVVVTLWYRAPELLLGIKEYSTPIDLWSVGCVFAELLTMKPLFPGKSEVDQINRIFKDLGTPNEKIWPGYNDLPFIKKCKFTTNFHNVLRKRFGTQLTNLGFDLMNKFLTYNPAARVTAEIALKHEYFTEDPYPVKPSKFPIWPAKSEQMPRNISPKPPSGGKQFAKQLENDDDDILNKGFHLTSTAKGPAFSLKF